MAFTEDPSVFLADFGGPCTLNGAAVTAIVDTDGYVDPETGVVTEGPSAQLTTAQASAAAPGQAFVELADPPRLLANVNYIVRQVLKEPPDGAFTRLVLARS